MLKQAEKREATSAPDRPAGGGPTASELAWAYLTKPLGARRPPFGAKRWFAS